MACCGWVPRACHGNLLPLGTWFCRFCIIILHILPYKLHTQCQQIHVKIKLISADNVFNMRTVLVSQLHGKGLMVYIKSPSIYTTFRACPGITNCLLPQGVVQHFHHVSITIYSAKSYTFPSSFKLALGKFHNFLG